MEEPITLTGAVGIANVGDYNPDEWPVYYKQVPTKAVRVAGPFVVLTSEGELNCVDGYVAIDARGYPYPIATDEFELIYGKQKPPASFPPVTVHEIAVAHSFGVLTKDVATAATRKLLAMYGLVDEDGGPA